LRIRARLNLNAEAAEHSDVLEDQTKAGERKVW
jgi:hypothetical protein